MAAITIRELPLKYFEFSLDGVEIFQNRRNDLTIDSKRVPGTSYAHFKTSEGASIFEKQNVLPTDVTVIDINDNSYSPTDMDQLKGYLDDIHFYDWQTNYGGGGGGSASRFDQLDDTFNYVGKQGYVPRVNGSETGLEAVPLYNYERITEHVDWGDQNPLQPINDGKRVVQAFVSGQPKLILADDTANAPIPPNALLNDFTPTNDDNDWTVPSGRLWRIDGIQYSNGLDFTQTITPAASGKIRQDIFYVTSDNEIHYLQGIEGNISAPTPQTPVPANSISAISFTVTADMTAVEPSPFGTPWVTKESYGGMYLYASGTYDIPRTNRTHIFIMEDATVTGFKQNSDAPDSDGNYYNQHFWVQSANGSSVTLKNLNSTELPFRFPGGNDLDLEANQTAEFFYNKVDNVMDYVGVVSSGSGSNAFPLPSGTPVWIGRGFLNGSSNPGDSPQFGDIFYWATETVIYAILIWKSGDGTLLEHYEIIESYNLPLYSSESEGGSFDDTFDDTMN
jgi:hypothetical protein